jgi:hypothetical protein
MPLPSLSRPAIWTRALLVAAACLAVAWAAQTARRHAAKDGLGIAPGKITHVWLIILENKSYDATFTGLNHNTYLWQTLPAQGVLLKRYYGTGHYSLDNYISLVSGQATQPDTQADCPQYDDFDGHVDLSGSLATNPNYGQMVSSQGANARPGSNGCVYPRQVLTLFNQLDAAHVSWKGYAQDLGNPDTPNRGLRGYAAAAPHDNGPCGAPYPSPAPQGSTREPNPGAANPTDQYVPKHFPFVWFRAVLQSGDCNATHIANLFDPRHGLLHDLRSAATTPAFSWITPNNCSDAHDAVCAGNNLSGGWLNPLTPKPPLNHAGGLYAADLFLEHVIPEIEASPAFRDGGLIDITFDEAFPPFVYTGNSAYNSTAHRPVASYTIRSDAAGETIDGRTVHTEPTGPNTPLLTGTHGRQLYPGPGSNAFIDRPAACLSWKSLKPGEALPPGACLLGLGHHPPGAQRQPRAVAPARSSIIRDDAIAADDRGRPVSGAGIPPGAFVGAVTQTPLLPPTARSPHERGSFVLVDAHGRPLPTAGAVHGIVLGALTAATDPLYDSTDATPGGGDTGSVLISPYIRPGSVSRIAYNHYSWLRTMEDLFQVAHASPGLDGLGHLGYAAQPGLAPFGRDVFTHPQGQPSAAALLGLPAWLPRPARPVGRIVNASPAHPRLAVQGESAWVSLPRARILATAIGPRVPEEGDFPVPVTSACSFAVTLHAASGQLRLSPAQFTITDEYGRTHHPRVTGPGGAPLPRRLLAGQTLHLRIRDVLPTGNGRLHWAPQSHTSVVSWDFDVEID